MKGALIYHTYRIQDNKAFVYLYGRFENGETFCSIHEFRPHFYIKLNDLEKAKRLVTIQSDEGTEVNFEGEKLAKITVTIPAEVPELRKLFEKEGIACYEADIRFTMLFLIEHNILWGIKIEGESKKNPNIAVDHVFENPKIKPTEVNTDLKVLSFDIETGNKNKDLYSVAFYTKTGSKEELKTLIVSKDPVKNAEHFENEHELLKKFHSYLYEIDPDIITGWHVIDFDIKFLRDKYKQYNMQLNWGKDQTEMKVRVASDFFQDSTAECVGRQILDGIALMKTSFVKLQDYKLDTAAEHFLGEKKLIGHGNKVTEIEEAFENDKEKLAEYNAKDAKLVVDILEKSGVLDLTIKRAQLTGMTLDRVKASIASLDSLYLRELKKQNKIARSLVHTRKDKGITGGYVRDSTPGIYENILILDFKSLYPSIMRTFNIDPASYIEDKDTIDRDNKEEYIVAPNGAVFKNGEGILPQILTSLWRQRDLAKKNKNDMESFAIKILMNSFFGVLASPNCRFFSMEMSNAITHFGQALIKTTAKWIEEKGYDVIYGDTDSIFINPKVEDIKSAIEIGKTMETEINTRMNAYVKEKYHRESFLDLEFEKTFTKFLLPKVRGSEGGAKKRYAGLLLKEGKEKMDFTGLEFVRSDWTELAKKFQLTVLEKIFAKEEVTEYMKSFVESLKAGKYDELVIYRKSLRKGVEEYTKTTPPHVKAARKLDKIESTKIEYVMTTDGPEPVQKRISPIDYDHYIEKQLKPIADSILDFYGTTFEELTAKTKQKSLFEF